VFQLLEVLGADLLELDIFYHIDALGWEVTFQQPGFSIGDLFLVCKVTLEANFLDRLHHMGLQFGEPVFDLIPRVDLHFLVEFDIFGRLFGVNREHPSDSQNVVVIFVEV
jgi:hypothetical protein